MAADYEPLDVEREVREFWGSNRIPLKLVELRKRENVGTLGFVEGPPTLNGVPHVGHARGRVIKDLRYRWKSMQGYYVAFRAGWDCQGLPVELEVEKKLGVRNKRELLERIKEEVFVEECKRTIERYYKEWIEADHKLGMFMDYERAYWTHKDEYIEREWHYLKQAWERALLGEGYYVVAYCPSCQTSLSNIEVGRSYEDVEDPSVYFKLKIVNRYGEYFLAWTTMPFTIVTNLMLAVHPAAEYVKVAIGEERWILAKGRVEPVMQELGIKEYRILESFEGEELEGLKYEHPFEGLIPEQKELDKLPFVHTVVCEGFVDVKTATGVVHLAPGNGEEDFEAARRRNVPIYAPFDDECKFTEGAGAFSGLFARDADAVVVEELHKRGLLACAKSIRHEYPTCWRSGHKLIWIARREYFLWTDRINEDIVRAAEGVKYFYEEPKNRFLAFLKEARPWCVSRERVWGTPLPIWVCERCGHKILVSSRKELLERAIEPPAEWFELHKPWIDRITLKCDVCGGRAKREPFVLDCWHNSGASPYAGFNDEEFDRFVPVDFLIEGIDQTRGWANSLLLQHVILTGRAEAPYKAFLFCGHVLDAMGRKMSKSLGNVIEVNWLLKRQSADVCRFYLLWKCSPIDQMSFDVGEMKKRPYQVLNTIYHLHRFLLQNAEYDGFNPREHTLTWAERNRVIWLPDRWLLSKLQEVVEDVTKGLERCEFHLAASALEEFVINTISRAYVPMVRRELWSDAPETLSRRLAIYATIWHTLKALILLFNPMTPFLCEFLHQRVYRRLDPSLPESVNFERWPISDEGLRDRALERDVELLLKCVSLAHSARQSAKLKRRWPLRKAVIVAPQQALEAVQRLREAFVELANVKEVDLVEAPVEYDLRRWASASEGELTVLLDLYRDEALIGEGIARDIARRVQALRKELGFVPTDVVKAVHVAELDEEAMRLVRLLLPQMRDLVRAKEVYVHERRPKLEGVMWHEYKMDERVVSIAIIN